MELSICLIFEMRNVRINSGKVINIYKLVDISYGLYFNLNNIETLLPLNSDYSSELLYIVCEENKKRLGESFNEERFYAGSVNQEYLEELLKSCDNNINKVKENLFNKWGKSYLFFSNGHNFNVVQNEENIKLCDETFKGNINYKINSKEHKISNVEKTKLLKYGTFLTDKEYNFNPAVGREEEIKRLEMALLSFDVNGLLVGDAGVGKTAIVEGLAYKIQKGLVHEKLKNIEIVSISSTSMISGARYVGDKEERMQEIINILKDNKNIIMFTDEIHTLIGAGMGSKSNLDVANILKPYLDRGDIKVIGSTTEDEYDNLMNDSAFKSRFKKIKVQEPDEDLLLEILEGVIKGLEKTYNIKFEFDESIKMKIYDLLIDLTSSEHRDYKDKNNNPRLILSIIKDMFSSAVYNNNENISIVDIVFAINECDRIYDSVKERYILEITKLLLSENVTKKQHSKILKFKDNI